LPAVVQLTQLVISLQVARFSHPALLAGAG